MRTGRQALFALKVFLASTLYGDLRKLTEGQDVLRGHKARASALAI